MTKGATNYGRKNEIVFPFNKLPVAAEWERLIANIKPWPI